MQPFFQQATDDAIIISPWRKGQGYFPGNIDLYHNSREFEEKYQNKKIWSYLNQW